MAALGVGLPLLAIHGQRTCDDAPPIRCPEGDRNTLAPGLALTIGGSAAAVTSALFFYLHARSDTDRRASAVAISPWAGPQGAGFSAALSF